MPIGIGAGIAISAAASAGAGVYAAHKQASAASDAAGLQTNAANHGADLQAQAAQQALDFQKSQAAQNQSNFDTTQQKNYQLYLDQQARLAPYRNMGQATLGQLSQPIPGMTIGDLAKRTS